MKMKIDPSIQPTINLLAKHTLITKVMWMITAIIFGGFGEFTYTH